MSLASSKSPAAGEVNKNRLLCMGCKTKVPGVTFQMDTKYPQKKFRPYPKTQTFTAIIPGACMNSIQHTFAQTTPMPWDVPHCEEQMANYLALQPEFSADSLYRFQVMFKSDSLDHSHSVGWNIVL